MKRMNRNTWKRALLVMLLLGVCVLLSSCYTDQDRVVDNNNGLNIDTNQTFQQVITPTPSATPTPTPKPTQNTQVDWSNWNFGDENATNPPSVVTTPSVQNSSSPQNTVSTGVNTVTATPKTGTVTVKPTTATVTATPKPTQKATSVSNTLKLGSTGSEVKRLQQRLKDLGYLTGSVDGTYGKDTESAVKDFQSVNGLSADGKAGTRTQNLLYSSNAKKKTASSVTKKPTATTNISTAYTNGKTDIYLQLGSSGTQVKILQNRLIVLGYLSGTADGTFGSSTEAAVKAFQKRNSIWDDGIAGPSTLSKLYSSSAKKAASVVASLGSLKPGMNGNAVRALQTNLKKLGYYSGLVDGDYGDGTTAAVKAFQAANGLTADGVAGKNTQNKILEAVNGGSSSSSSSGGSSSSPENYGKTAKSNGYSTISSSTTSTSNVKALQSALAATGYYSGNMDGDFGKSTESAVKSYQRAAGLRVTGMAGPTTQRLLYGGTSESGSYTKLKLGSTGSAVKTLQYALYELKYYDGKISGTYDEATENAVMLFQECNGLEVDGVAGQGTQRKLYSSNAIPCNK